jgi:hypothetical protein
LGVLPLELEPEAETNDQRPAPGAVEVKAALALEQGAADA